jgi:hypothetical protein
VSPALEHGASALYLHASDEEEEGITRRVRGPRMAIDRLAVLTKVAASSRRSIRQMCVEPTIDTGDARPVMDPDVTGRK